MHVGLLAKTSVRISLAQMQRHMVCADAHITTAACLHWHSYWTTKFAAKPQYWSVCIDVLHARMLQLCPAGGSHLTCCVGRISMSFTCTVTVAQLNVTWCLLPDGLHRNISCNSSVPIFDTKMTVL